MNGDTCYRCLMLGMRFDSLNTGVVQKQANQVHSHMIDI